MPFVCLKFTLIGPFVGYGKPLIFYDRRAASSINGVGPQCGFTLIELFVTLTVLAIILALATPNIRDLLQRNKLVAQANDLIADINLARSSAITGGERIVICASNNQTNCTNNAWSTGWIVFTDCDQNGSVTASGSNVCPGPTGANQLPERIIKARKGVEPGTTITETQNSGAARKLRYTGIGMMFTSGNDHILRVCATGIADGRRISVNALGRPLVSVWASTETNPCP
jgi:prepilin-type N-terminal cleavage/methylation domain-containing protein